LPEPKTSLHLGREKIKIGIRESAEILGISALVISLMFVGYELRLSRSIAETEGFATSHEQNRSIREFIAANSEIWYRGCLGEELSPEDSVVFVSIAQSLFNRAFTRWSRSGIGITGATQESLATGVALNRYRFPGYNEAWEKNELSQISPLRERNSSNWRSAVEEMYIALVDSDFDRSFDVAWCGR